MDIYRIFQCSEGTITQIAFVASRQSALKYLQICYNDNPLENVFYFACKVHVEI